MAGVWIHEHIHKSLTITPYDSKWIPLSARFVVLGQHPRATGSLQVYQMDDNDAKVVNDLETKSGLKCGTFGASALSNPQLTTGSFDGHVAIYDITRLPKHNSSNNSNNNSCIYNVQGHASIINCIDGIGGSFSSMNYNTNNSNKSFGAPEVVTGGRDGRVCVWDPRQKDFPVAAFEPTNSTSSDSSNSALPNSIGNNSSNTVSRDCWCVAFGGSYNDTERSILAGYDNGDVKLFDLRFGKVRWETNVRNGICGIEFDRKDIEMNKAVLTCLESQFHVYDLRTHHPEKGYAGRTVNNNNPSNDHANTNDNNNNDNKSGGSTVWGVKHLPQNRDVFVTLGGDGISTIYKYEYPDSRVVYDSEQRPYGVAGSVSMVTKQSIATQPLSSWDWNKEKQGLACCTAFDQTLRVLLITKLNTV